MSLPEEGAAKPAHAANFRDMLRLIMPNQAQSPPHSVVAASEHSPPSESTAETNDDRANVEEESNAEANDDDRANVDEVPQHSSSAYVGLNRILSRLQGPVSHVLYDRVVDHLNSENLHFEGNRDLNVIKLCFSGNNANYNIYFDIRNRERDCIIVYVMSPVKIPEAKRMQACEYITRANYGIIAGNFEMDFRDGEVRFKSSIEFPEGKLSEEMIKLLWVKPLSAIDNYFPGLMRVVYSNESAADAIREIDSRAAEGSSGNSSLIQATAVRVISDSSANFNVAATNE